MLNPLTRTADIPTQLAFELAQAKAQFETRRASVIQRGVARQEALLELIAETQAEHNQIANTVHEARGGSIE